MVRGLITKVIQNDPFGQVAPGRGARRFARMSRGVSPDEDPWIDRRGKIPSTPEGVALRGLVLRPEGKRSPDLSVSLAVQADSYILYL